MTTETAVIKLVLDASGFDRSMTQSRAAVDGFGDRVTTGAKGTAALDQGIRGLSERAADMRPKIASVSTAVAGMSGALQGALGPTAAWATGINGLVGSFAVGGVFAVGIAAATAGVGFLAKSFLDVKRKAEEARIASVKAAQDLEDALLGQVQSLEESIGRIAGLEPIELRFARLSQELIDARQALADIPDVMSIVATTGSSVNDALDLQNDLVADQTKRIDDLQTAYDNAFPALERFQETQKTLADLEARRKSIAEGRAADDAAAEAARARRQTETEAAALKSAVTMMNDAVALHEERLAAEAAAEQEAADDKMRLIDRQVRANETAFEKRMSAFDAAITLEEERERELAEVRRRIDEERLARQAVIAKNIEFTIGLAVESMSMFLDAAITGEEKALEKIAAFALKRVGTELVAIGTADIVKGAGLLFESVGADPRGYALVGLGTAAIGLGIGMGAAGTAVTHLAAGGTIGKPLETQTSDFGSRGISSGVSRGERRDRGAATSTTQTFIFNAPVVADHVTTPRFFLDQLRRGQRNQLEATP